MITLKSDSDLQMHLDQPSYCAILELMMKDCTAYSQHVGARANEWIPRLLLFKGSDHAGSKVPHGFFLLYQFRRLSFAFDMGIREIRIAENTDDFLDLYNEIQHDATIQHLKKGE